MDNSIKQRMESLKQQIETHNYNYYLLDRPQILDEEYDAMVQELADLEKSYPQFSDSKSPTQKVGGWQSSTFAPVKHIIKMESLSNAFSYEELQKFDNAVRKKLGDSKIEYVLEPKIDGLSVSLEYVDGIFVRGSTRGDGEVGEDVTENLKTIKSIPKKLHSNVKFLEVRGEVFISKKNFELINSKLDTKSKYSSSRNLAAGSLRQLDPQLVAERNLDIFVFNLQQIENSVFKVEKHIECLKYLKMLGLKVVNYYGPYTDLEITWKTIQKMQRDVKNLSFNADGMVIKVNDISQRELLGSTNKAPKWAIAYKFPTNIYETKLLDIQFLVGKSGVITPVAILEPIIIGSSLVQKASLHNFDQLLLKDFRIGDIVKIRKAGDVIPEILSPVLEKRTGKEEKIGIPDECPECKSPVIFEDNQYKCSNENCKGRLIRQIIHFASRNAMDISGLGESVIRQLVQYDFVKSISDLYYLTYHDLMQLDNVSTKSALKLLDNIEESLKKPFEKLLYALSIENVGQRAAKILSDSIEEYVKPIKQMQDTISKFSEPYHMIPKSLDSIKQLRPEQPIFLEYVKKLKSFSVDELLKLPDIGEETATSIKNYFSDNKNIENLNKIMQSADKK